MFITVACGAISGFHATQSPLMARCMKSEKQGHFVFYGAMVAEGVIALIWAAAGCSIYEVTDGLSTGLSAILANGQSAAIYDVCSKTMGGVGVALAMIGVIVCPITSGDTAFRSARLTLADWFGIDQGKFTKRLILCVPLLAVGAFVGHLDYTIIWRYFSWTKPDTRYDCIVDSKYVLIQRKEELLDYRSTGNLYECCVYDLFLLCKRMSESWYKGSLSSRYYYCSGILWNIYVCNKKAN